MTKSVSARWLLFTKIQEPGPGSDRPGCQSGKLDSRRIIIRGLRSDSLGHDLDDEEDVAANVLLFSGLLEKSDRYKYRALACQTFPRVS